MKHTLTWWVLVPLGYFIWLGQQQSEAAKAYRRSLH
jgi:hypothetical protein